MIKGKISSLIPTKHIIPSRSSVSKRINFSQRDFNLMFEDLAVGMVMNTPDGKFLQVNPAFCRFLGYTQEEMMKLSVFDITHPEDREETRGYFNEVLVGERHTIGIEKRYLHKNGYAKWGQVTASWLFDQKGHPLYAVALIQDISHRKKIEVERLERLRRAQVQQNTIVRLAMNSAVVNGDFQSATQVITEASAKAMNIERVSIWLLSEDGHELRCVDLYEKSKNKHSTGMSLFADEYPSYFEALQSGRAINAHNARRDRRTSEFTDDYLIPLGIRSLLDAAIRVSGKIVGVVCHEHVHNIRVWLEDETAFAGEIADQVAQVVLNSERKIAIENLHKAHMELENRVGQRTKELSEEITEKERAQAKEKELRAQLLQVEKLSSIGLLTAGLAHELNNPLTGLLSLLRMYLKRKEEGSEDHQFLSDMLEAADHMAKIIEDLNHFSSVSEGKFSELQLNKVIDSTLSFSAHQFKRDNILIRKEYTQNLPLIRGDKSQLQQVILNLLTNARDAMEQGGEVTIKTSFDEKRSAVLLQVKDSGAGIRRDNIPKLFDPFFTTKVLGKGIGLGLSVLHGIVQAHKGQILIDSKVGRGTKFIVVLPAINYSASQS